MACLLNRTTMTGPDRQVEPTALIRHFPDDFLVTTAVSVFFDSTSLERFVNPILDAPDA